MKAVNVTPQQIAQIVEILQQQPQAAPPQEPAGAITSAHAESTYDDAQAVIDELRSGMLDASTARIYLSAIRAKQSHVRIAFDHAKATSRLQENSPVLPDFEFRRLAR